MKGEQAGRSLAILYALIIGRKGLFRLALPALYQRLFGLVSQSRR
jgi:tetrahydromethanopterin S-methyltransferase subunit G